MPQKEVGKLKEKDMIFAAAFSKDKGIGYPAWCTVTKVDDIRVYDSTNTKNREFKEVYFTPNSGKLKGDVLSQIFDAKHIVAIPREPNKLVQIWRILKK